MGNKQSCCIYHSPKSRSQKRAEAYKPARPAEPDIFLPHGNQNAQLEPKHSTSSLTIPQHISEREPEGKMNLILFYLCKTDIFFILFCLKEHDIIKFFSIKRHLKLNHEHFCRSLQNPHRQAPCTSLRSRLDGTINQGLFWPHLFLICHGIKIFGHSIKGASVGNR